MSTGRRRPELLTWLRLLLLRVWCRGSVYFYVSRLRVSYPVIQIATQSGKSVYLTVTKDTSDSVVLMFKLISNRAASGLYRAITETHAFYR